MTITRNNAIVIQYLAGESYQAVAERHGLTRQAVHQIAREAGVAGNGGRPVTDVAKNKRRRVNRRGCPEEIYQAIPELVRKRFNVLVHNWRSQQRKISADFTCWDYWQLVQESGLELTPETSRKIMAKVINRERPLSIHNLRLVDGAASPSEYFGKPKCRSKPLDQGAGAVP